MNSWKGKLFLLDKRISLKYRNIKSIEGIYGGMVAFLWYSLN